ncbi:hypothetical protein CANCADRAFT_32196 [Tortispora caseinolytica NRRL Y-17796]|uniref:Uncharacterized protein n=1 Tax=Tortispora caseinolytica NRRL Y-17796 TaxID=767744 RepID=A0A1E4TA55_9ASCO|nr:hypothetical protein CANCADRAFT_32196 [Tortispora caseinolytica NRRL Y-17796]
MEDQKPLEVRLERIRTQINSKIEHQKQVAVLLLAFDEQIKAENAQDSPSTYFTYALSLLDESVKSSQREMISSNLYILSVFAPYVTQSLLSSKFHSILDILAPAMDTVPEDSLGLRSVIGILEGLLLALNYNGWSQTDAKESTKTLLALAMDDRPKVRHRALEALKNILSSPPPSASLTHPASKLCAETAFIEASSEAKKLFAQPDMPTAKLIHALQLVRAISSAGAWPAASVSDLCELLLLVCRSSNQSVVSMAFGAFEDLFQSVNDREDAGKIGSMVDDLAMLKPSLNDEHLAPAWLAIYSQGLGKLASLAPTKCFLRLPKAIKTVIEFNSSSSTNIQISATQGLIALVSTCIADEVILSSRKDVDSTFEQITALLSQLISVQYQGARDDIFQLFTAMFESYRTRAAEYLSDLLSTIGSIRAAAPEEVKTLCDQAIGAAIGSMGPEKVLEVLPLNLTTKTATGRAWMIPLLRDNIKSPHLAHFSTEMLPLAEELYSQLQEVQAKGHSIQSKVLETIIDQIWSTLPRYCDLPVDLQDAFTQTLAEALTNALYNFVELRPYICQSLRLLVESNAAYIAMSESDVPMDAVMLESVTPDDAEKNIEYLAQFAGKILAVLFNVFSQTAPEYRQPVLEAIEAYLAIIKPKELSETFDKVCGLLAQSLDADSAASKHKLGKGELPPMSYTMMDIVVVMTPFLSAEAYNSLVTIFMQTVKSTDAQIQKRAYRILSKLMATDDGNEFIASHLDDLQSLLISIADSTPSPAVTARLNALHSIVELLPATDLHFIPATLSEVVMATKEANERTRTAAFDLAVAMARRMKEGGTIVNSKVPDLDKDAPDTEASLNEFFTMLAAGLAGTTPNMISATITVISRILFEFKDEMQESEMAELSSTVVMFLTSKNREIVKSAIGFVKVMSVSLPVSILEDQLSVLVENLLTWSREHNSHFKEKVRHIFERLLRRVSYKLLEEQFPEADKKFLTNIRKSKERAKRRKAEGAGASSEPNNGKNTRSFSSAYDEALYGSDSEDEGDDDFSGSEADEPSRKNKKNGKANKTYIVEEDEVVDLLNQEALAHISSSKPKKSAKKSVTERAGFKEKQGRLLFTETTDRASALESEQAEGSSINAYLDAVAGADMPTRGQRNKLKFKNKRRRDGEWDDDEGDDGENHDINKGMQSNEVRRKKQGSGKWQKRSKVRR